MPIEDISVEALVASRISLSDNSERTETSVKLDLRQVEKFAEGNFSTVSKASLRVEGHTQTVAVKTCILPPNIKSREVSILRGLTHPNVLKLLYYWTVNKPNQDTQLNLVCEYLPQTLYQVRKSCLGNLPMELIKKYMLQLLRAVEYIHEMRVMHRDIKPQNIIVNSNKQLLKLADFGSAKVLKEGEKNSSIAYIVSRHYRAPELLLGSKKYSFEVDIWSVGCVIGELLQKSVLFPGSNQTEQMRLILNILGSPTFAEMDLMKRGRKSYLDPEVTSDRRLRPLPPASWTSKFSKSRDDISRPVIDLIKGLLQFCPAKRLTATQALKAVFFNEDLESIPSANLYLPPMFSRQTADI